MKCFAFAATAFVLSGSAQARPVIRNLQILPNGHVRFDSGPELDRRQLTLEIQKMSREQPQPEVHIVNIGPAKSAKYDDFAAVLAAFSREHYNHLGIPGFTSK
jgi:biopolymer transport protein ExbD